MLIPMRHSTVWCLLAHIHTHIHIQTHTYIYMHTMCLQSEVWAGMEGSDERKRLEALFMKEMEEWKKANADAAGT